MLILLYGHIPLYQALNNPNYRFDMIFSSKLITYFICNSRIVTFNRSQHYFSKLDHSYEYVKLNFSQT